jgi:aminoacylase
VLVTSTGPTGHGSRFIQDTAVEKLVKFAGRAFEFRRSEEAAFVGKAGGGHVAGCAHASAKKLGEVTTLNVTFLKAGVMMQQEPQQAGSEDRVSLNVVPTEARAGLDLRVPPSVPIAAVTDLLDAWCREAGDTSWTFAPWTQPVEAHFTSSTDRTDKFWAAFQDALGATGVRVELEVFPAGTDSRFLRQVGVQAFGFSPIRNTPILLHEHDEWLGVHTLVEGVAVYERLLQALCVDLL